MTPMDLSARNRRLSDEFQTSIKPNKINPLFLIDSNDRAALTRFRRADEKPVLLADSRRANGILNQVMPTPDLCRVLKLEAHIPGDSNLIGYQRAA